MQQNNTTENVSLFDIYKGLARKKNYKKISNDLKPCWKRFQVSKSQIPDRYMAQVRPVDHAYQYRTTFHLTYNTPEIIS